MRHTLSTLIAMLLVGLLAMAPPVIAQTPDGETPASEDACEILSQPGATKGLYGLCIAFCEAQDMESEEDKAAATKILANYDKRKTASDPDMPCLQAPCPCVASEARIDEVGDTSSPERNYCRLQGTFNELNLFNSNGSQILGFNAGLTSCVFYDPAGDPVITQLGGLSQEEGQACLDLIEKKCCGMDGVDPDNDGCP